MENILEICLTRPLIWAGFFATIGYTCFGEELESRQTGKLQKGRIRSVEQNPKD
jgi:hypothetical protein